MKHLLFTAVLLFSIFSFSQVGVGTASPDASAVLEVSSTSKGFLPPRMTYAQRNLITVSPSLHGLMVYCTNCGSGEMQIYNGTAWTNVSGAAASVPIVLTIGQTYGGGKVAYILQLGDPGYDANVQHGLIAATVDQGGIRWHNGSNITTGATASALGTGMANTNTIIAVQGAVASSYAAGLARAYNGGGYTDWYLPSKDELHKLYLNKTAIGGLSIPDYWSSTEYDSSYAWREYGANGAQNVDYFKEHGFLVRAVRSF